MTDTDTILDQSFELLQKILSNKGKLNINRKIHYKIERLCREHGYKPKEILGALAEIYLRKRLYEKYQAETALSTFMLHFINYSLNALSRKCDTHRRHYHEIFLEDLDGLESDCIAEITTPEDLIIGKQLLELMIKHYGIEDVLVLLGHEDRQAAADRLKLTYESYCKRLFRKTLLFLPILDHAGYLISE